MEYCPASNGDGVTYDEKDVYELCFPDGTSKSMISIDDTHFSMDFLLERNVPNLIPTVTNAHKLHCRDDDIFICAFMKAGTHWVSEICKMLLSDSTKYDPNGKESYMLELRTQDHLDNLSSPRVLNSHLLPRQLPACILQKKTKIIFIHRNPKDIAVSSYHHLSKLHDYACSFPAFLKVFQKQEIISTLLEIDKTVNLTRPGVNLASYYVGLLLNGLQATLKLMQSGPQQATLFHNWFDYTTAWEEAMSNKYKDMPILQLSYEDMKRDGITNIRKIAHFLELERDEDLLFEINARCGFDNMKNAKLALAEIKKIIYRKRCIEKVKSETGKIGLQ